MSEKEELALIRQILQRPMKRFLILMEQVEDGEKLTYKKAIESALSCSLDTNMNLPEYTQVGQAWKTFNKWMKERKLGTKFGDGTLKSGHICIVLKGIGFTLYFYEIIDDYTEEQYQIFEHIRLLLDRVLICNQNASYRLKSYLVKYKNWKKRIFPHFFESVPKKKIISWSDQIDDEIEKWSNTKYVFRKINRERYWNQITTKNLLDIKGCYAKLLSLFNTIKPDLPTENISIIEELILRCEHGYYLGFILEKTFKEFEEKYPTFEPPERTKTWRLEKLDKFRRGREDRVYEATKTAFGLTRPIKRKLRRLFIFKKI